MMRRADLAPAADGAGGLPIVNHLLQHTLRNLCGAPQQVPFWVYSIFWRILPRNYPPPKWDNDEGPFDRSKGNKRNWILVWEDGFCDFVACEKEFKDEKKKYGSPSESLQPELFFKMSHDVYNYGEGLMGKIAAERSHKWIYSDPSSEQEDLPLSCSWQVSTDSYPRTWEAQFKAGIQTIAIIAVGEGLLQLGSTKKVPQDMEYVLMLQRKFNYLQSIPGVFAQTKMTRAASINNMSHNQHVNGTNSNVLSRASSGVKRPPHPDNEEDEACSTFPIYTPNLAAPRKLPVPSPNLATDMPSMYSSLQALLSKLPAVTPSVGTGTTRMEMMVNASAKTLSPALLPTTNNYWPNIHEAVLHPAPFPPSSANTAFPTSTDEFESYHCSFGQPIS